jgi:hypothetical protein
MVFRSNIARSARAGNKSLQIIRVIVLCAAARKTAYFPLKIARIAMAKDALPKLCRRALHWYRQPCPRSGRWIAYARAVSAQAM